MRNSNGWFCARGSSSKYPGRPAVIAALQRGEKVSLAFGRDEHDQIVVVNPDTREVVGCIPPLVYPNDPEREDQYDLLECFIDLRMATPIAVKKSRDNIMIKVEVVTPEQVVVYA